MVAMFGGSAWPLIVGIVTFVGSFCIAFLFAVLLAREQMFDEEETARMRSRGKD